MAESTSTTNTLKKRWGKKEKGGKPWPGPPLAKPTKEKDSERERNIHLNLNLGSLKNGPNPRKNLEGTIPEPDSSGTTEESAGDKKSPRPPKPDSFREDIIVISVLWSMDVLHNTIRTFKNRIFSDIFTRAEEETIENLSDDKFILIFTLIPMLTMGTVLTFSFDMLILEFMQKCKFWIMFVSLAVYAFSAVVGTILAATRNPAVAVVLSWLEIGWYTVHPLRYWYIFHQKFPISIRWSHLFVSGNLLVIGVFDYIFTVLVKGATSSFSQTFFIVVFSICTVPAVSWVAGIFFIKQYLNAVEEDLEAVREEYEETEVIGSFDRRQEFDCIILFLALMCPSVIFPIMNVVVEVGQIALPRNTLNPVLGLSPYRPDLLCFLTVLIITEGLLQLLKIIRNELMDLFLIAVSHVFNLMAIIMFMQILYITNDYRRCRSPEIDDAIVVVNSNEQDLWFLQIGNEVQKWHKGEAYAVLRNLDEDGGASIVFAKPDTGEVVFEGTLDIEVSRNLSVNSYSLMRKADDYQLVKTPFPPVIYIENARIFITNAVEECSNFREKTYRKLFTPDATRGLKVNGTCLPISLQFYEVGDPNMDNSNTVVPFKPPGNNQISKVFEITCLPKKNNESDWDRLCNKPKMLRFSKLNLYLEEAFPAMRNETFEYPLLYKPHELINVRIEEQMGKNVPIIVVRSDLVQLRTVDDKDLITASSLYGISLGFGWVGYIHFLWIQSPVKCRTIIIFTFFAMMFTASSLSERYFTKFQENDVFSILVVATFCFLGHMVANLVFVIWWVGSRKQDQPQQPWRRY